MIDVDDAGSIGKRYRRQDEVGTPLCVTIDFDSLDDAAVTVRDRDTMEQARVPIAGLVAELHDAPRPPSERDGRLLRAARRRRRRPVDDIRAAYRDKKAAFDGLDVAQK